MPAFDRTFLSSRRTVAAAALLIASLMAGCKSTHTESYSIELRNAGTEPITVWLTKTGERNQADWLAPEDLGTTRAASVDRINGVVIPPGRTGTVGPIEGEFGWEDLAMLRVYAGKVSFDQMLATPADGKLRVDVPLDEGMNHVTVKNPPLSAERGTAAPATAP